MSYAPHPVESPQEPYSDDSSPSEGMNLQIAEIPQTPPQNLRFWGIWTEPATYRSAESHFQTSIRVSRCYSTPRNHSQEPQTNQMKEPKPNGRNPMGLQQLLDHDPPQPDTLESLAANHETLLSLVVMLGRLIYQLHGIEERYKYETVAPDYSLPVQQALIEVECAKRGITFRDLMQSFLESENSDAEENTVIVRRLRNAYARGARTPEDLNVIEAEILVSLFRNHELVKAIDRQNQKILEQTPDPD